MKNKLIIFNNESLNINASITNSIVEFDFTELKETIKKELVPYELGEIEKFKEGKKELAKLRALQKGIEDFRKELERKYLENFYSLETELKELSNLINPSIENFNNQIKANETIEKELKKETIEKLIAEIKLNNSLEFEIEIENKWLNKTTKLKDIEIEIWEFIDKKLTEKKVNRTLEFDSLTLEQAKKMMEFFKLNKIDFKVL
ncbi:MAG: DUF1351 domain-containing protein [Cetobacterium sp.]